MMNNDKGNMPTISPTTNTAKSLPTPKSRPFVKRLRSMVLSYGAALFMVGTLIPIFASLVTVGIFISRPNVPFLGIDPRSNWYSIVVGLVLTTIIWLFIALLYSPFTTAERANANSYNLLRSRLSELYVRLGIYGQGSELIEKIVRMERDTTQVLDSYTREAELQAIGACKILLQMLYVSPSGLHWSLGDGYTIAWKLIHQAEEALIYKYSVAEVVAGALYDEHTLVNSQLPDRDALLNRLLRAVLMFEPEAIVYFEGQTVFKKKIFAEKQPENIFPDEKLLAREILRQTRHVINRIGDERRDGLIRARNQLLWTIALTGTITYSMVFLSIVFNISTANIIACASFYIVGAVTGLFGRLYNELIRRVSVVDDFGLFTTRIIITPLLSGLAGVGGVLLGAVIITTFAPLVAVHPSTLTTTAFTLNGVSLLIACLVGFMPNILINGFQHGTRRFETELRDAGSESGSEQSPVEPTATSIIDQQLVKIYHYNVDQARLWFRLSVIAAALGLITILSGIIIILLNGGVLLGIVIALSGSIPELGAALAFQRSKSIATPLNQRESLMDDGQIATVAHVQEQRQPVSTGASSPLAGSDDA